MGRTHLCNFKTSFINAIKHGKASLTCWSRVILTFGLLHPNCCGIYHSMCPSGLVEIAGEILRNRAERNFCDLIRLYVTLTFDRMWPWPLTTWLPKLIFSCPLDHLCQFASKSVHFFSKYRVHKIGNRQDRETDGRTTPEHNASGRWEDRLSRQYRERRKHHKDLLRTSVDEVHRAQWVGFNSPLI